MAERPPLTSSNLQSLDICATKAQRDARITSFLQSQSRYVSYFASEGRLHLAEDGCTTPSKQNKAQSPSENYLIGFATPTLKPRVSKKEDKSVNDDDHHVKDHKVGPKNKNKSSTHNHYDTQNPPHSSKPHHEHHHHHYYHKSTSPSTDKKKKHAYTTSNMENKAAGKIASEKKKRAHEECTSEIERDARLEERRSRKRRKREIVKAPSSESGTEPNTTSKNRKEDKKKVKLPAGLALMQSFIAPNVGKNRLTLKTPFSTGVFLKGKASVPKKIGKRHEKGNNSSTTTVAEKSDGGNLSQNRKAEPKPSLRNKSHSKPSKQNVSTFSSIADEDVSAVQIIPHKIRISGKRPVKRASSIVWDIEKQSMSHSSTTSQIPRPSKSTNTVVLDTNNAAWTQHPAITVNDFVENQGEECTSPSATTRTAADHNIDEATILETPTSSISPSQSVSQVDSHPVPRETVSRFFTQPPPLEDTYAGGAGGLLTPPQPTSSIQMNPLPLQVAPRYDVESLQLEDGVDIDTARRLSPVTNPNFSPANAIPDLDDPLTGMAEGVHDGNMADVDSYPTAMMMQYATSRDHDLVLGLDMGTPIAIYDEEGNLDLETGKDRPFHRACLYYENDFLDPHAVGVRITPGSREHHGEHDTCSAHCQPYMYERDYEPELVDSGDDDAMPYQEWLDECEVDEYLRDERGYEYEYDYDYGYNQAYAEQEVTTDMQDDDFRYDAWSEEQFVEEEEEAFEGPVYYEHEHEYEGEQGSTLLDRVEEKEDMQHADIPCEDDAVEEIGEDHGKAFQEGRALLLGLSFDAGKHKSMLECSPPDLGFVTDAELDVGKCLRDHWRPQRL